MVSVQFLLFGPELLGNIYNPAARKGEREKEKCVVTCQRIV